MKVYKMSEILDTQIGPKGNPNAMSLTGKWLPT